MILAPVKSDSRTPPQEAFLKQFTKPVETRKLCFLCGALDGLVSKNTHLVGQSRHRKSLNVSFNGGLDSYFHFRA